jgi:hypothetical protein
MGDVELKGATKCPGCGGEGDLVGYRLVRVCCGWVFGPVPGDCENYMLRPLDYDCGKGGDDG